MNRLKQLFQRKQKGIISVYFTAGFPNLEDTARICRLLEENGADLVEIGVPFSDPVADGETIQKSNQKAIDNGMTLVKLFAQLEEIRKFSRLPIVLMGYLNPFLQFGIKEFCEKCKAVGVDGTIIPDLPLELYLENYADDFRSAGLSNILLITPQTSAERIKLIDSNSDSFIYAVSSAAVTGGKIDLDGRRQYLERLKEMNLSNPLLVGFGISQKSDLEEVGKYAAGAIIGSAFIRTLQNPEDLETGIGRYMQSLLQ